MPYAEIEGRRLALSNLEKVLYPATGFTKGEALHYYASVSGAMLPHLHGRPASFLRYPDGVDAPAFFAKHVPPGTPAWVTVRETTRISSTPMNQVLVQDLATLIWAGNLAALEVHTPQWQIDREGMADRLVLDLDPGPGAGILECRTVAHWLQKRLSEDGITALPKTSGSKGLHLLAAVERTESSAVSAYAKRIAVEAETALPGLALSRMTRALRAGKVFVDHSQNAAAKTTAAPYTLRAKQSPTVSTPLSWDELDAAAAPDDLVFLASDLPDRLEQEGDLLGPLLNTSHASPVPAPPP